MLAVRKSRPGVGIDLVQVDAPTVEGGHDVLVEVRASGICGSDLQYYRWEGHGRSITTPVILGHEAAGVVVDIGPLVRTVGPGDGVAIESSTHCGFCDACLRGGFNRCLHASRIGYDRDGAMATHVVVDERSLHLVPAGLPMEQAALLKPLGVAVHAFERTPIQPGDVVAVVGAGTIGLMSAMVAHALGASAAYVVGSDRDDKRLALAERIGIKTVRAGATREESDADVTVEASGSGTGLQAAIELTTAGGGIAVIGVADTAVISPEAIVMKELTLSGVHTRQPVTWQRALRLLGSGAIDLDPLITHRLPLDEAKLGFDALLAGEAVKVVLEPGRRTAAVRQW